MFFRFEYDFGFVFCFKVFIDVLVEVDWDVEFVFGVVEYYFM